MPKLLVFVPCERVLIDQDNNVSLVSVMQEIRIPIAEALSPDVQAFVLWQVLAMWARLPADADCTFEQDLVLVAPDGSLGAHTKQQFSMSKQSHRNISAIHGFPVGQAGEYSLLLKLKDIRDDSKVLVEASYPLFVIHDAKPPSTS